MLINELLPDYDVSDRYHIEIDATAETVWQEMWTTDFCKSQVVSWLFFLRGLESKSLTLSDLDEMKFRMIAEKRGSEVAFGLIGQFWSPNGNLQDFDPKEFKGFDEIGFAKCVWSFQLEELGKRTRLTTETRVRCTDNLSRTYFDLYWAFVRPFSGWTRKEILTLIKQESEKRKNAEEMDN